MRTIRAYRRLPLPNRGLYRLCAWAYRTLRPPQIHTVSNLDVLLNIELQLNQWVDYNIYCLGLYEAHDVKWFIRQIQKDSVTLDIGAYIGQYGLLAVTKTKAGHVIAFEPHPQSFDRLKRNVARNGLDNVLAIHTAVGERRVKLPFAINTQPSNSGLAINQNQSAQSISVDVYSIDEIMAEHKLPKVDVMKIDVEGAEGLVLRGAQNTLRRFAPKMLIEVDRNLESGFGDTPQDVLAPLLHLGYKLFTNECGNLRSIHDIRAIYSTNIISVHPNNPSSVYT